MATHPIIIPYNHFEDENEAYNYFKRKVRKTRRLMQKHFNSELDL